MAFVTGQVLQASDLNAMLDDIVAARTFTAAIPGAVARPEVDKLRERVSVKDRGAFGDGIADDADAFNACLASNRTLYVPPGDYLLGTTVGATGLTDFTLLLAAGARLRQKPSLAGKLLAFNDATRVRLTSEGIGRIDVSEAVNSPQGAAYDAVSFEGGAGSRDCEVDHIHFYSGAASASAGGDSHVFFQGSGLNVHHCVFEGAWDLGVYVSGLGGSDTSRQGATVTQNRFVNCANACGSKRLFGGLKFVGNRVEGGVNGVFSGEADTANLPGLRNVYALNDFIGLTGSAIISRISQHDVIADNLLANCTGVSIIQLQGTRLARVSGNQVVVDPAVYVSPSSQRAINLESRTFNGTTYHSTDNDVAGNTVAGVYTAFREADVQQNRNRFLDNRASGETIRYGVRGPKSFFSDAQIARLQGVEAGFTGTERTEAQAAVRTTTASVLNAYLVAVAEGQMARVSAQVQANTAGSGAYGVRLEGTFRRPAGGSLAQVGTTAVTGEHGDITGLGGATLFADATGQAVRVRVAGAAATTVDWALTVSHVLLASNA